METPSFAGALAMEVNPTMVPVSITAVPYSPWPSTDCSSYCQWYNYGATEAYYHQRYWTGCRFARAPEWP